jgi:serine phosphatase RsbU (regulator of sigma subunit)
MTYRFGNLKKNTSDQLSSLTQTEFKQKTRNSSQNIRNLRLNSKLKELETFECKFDEKRVGQELYDYFLNNPQSPGVILTRQGVFNGFVSRSKFNEILTHPYGREIHLRRPLNTLYSVYPFIQQQVTIFGCEMPIYEAVNLGLQRRSEDLYEPIVIKFGERDYRSLAFHDLLSSQAVIYKIAMSLLEERTVELTNANEQISSLNQQLQTENQRMGAQLEVARKMQQWILPKAEELNQIEGLDIAGFMEPADEVGGDYYDVLHTDGVVTIGIGDVTGHGLESGLLMLMTQTAVRTLQESGERDPVRFLDTLNRTIYHNVCRMNSEKNLTLAILNYVNSRLSISGQHEETIVVRGNGEIERVDMMDLGLPIGLDEDILDFIDHTTVELQPEDGVVLYTDGIPEAYNLDKEQYGMERFCEVISNNWFGTAEEIKQTIINDLQAFIGKQKVFDDITLVVLKQK